MKKSLLTMSILLAAGSVSADPFYLDIGTSPQAAKYARPVLQ
jgi:hypothetical protein